MAPNSAWDEVLHRGRLLRSVPRLEDVVLPRGLLMRRALSQPLHWLVGPPKVGKTVIAHCIAYLNTLDRYDVDQRSRILVHEGPDACARGLEYLLEGPPTISSSIVLENPIGVERGLETDARNHFVELVGRVRNERPDVQLVFTSRHGPYLAAIDELRAAGLDKASGMTIEEWYDPNDLYARYSETIPHLTPDLAERLGCPALIHQFRDYEVVADPSMRPSTRRKYGDASNEITVDKLALLEANAELAILAMHLRLQEYAFVLPTVDDVGALLDRSYWDIPHSGLVATVFEFDGEPRLRFEHGTTREAAELLLRVEVGAGLPLLTPILANPRWGWPNRALDLWKTERAAAEGDWETVATTDHAALAAVAAQLVRISGGQDPGIRIVSDLDLDPWSAQDVGYALADTWHRSMPEPARGLAQRLARDHDGRGAYALLEALLYVLGSQVAYLWEQVDRAYADRVEEGPPWPDSHLRELLLAVDALAWRPPPDWHQIGTWLGEFLERLRPGDDGWALVRFLRSYHPDGLIYLSRISQKLADDVVADRGTPWTAKQAEIGLWLVQWHFVHQCRARAQVAHQPWVDRDYLNRTFHASVVDNDRDRDTAELVTSVTHAHPAGAGWGYFLAENLRVVDPRSFGQATDAAARRSLDLAGPADVGVLAAVLTYQPDGVHTQLVREHFEHNDQAQDALFRALTHGLVVDGVRLIEPHFSHRRSLGAIYDSCGIACEGLQAVLGAYAPLDNMQRFDVDAFIREFEEASATASLSLFQSSALDRLLPVVRGGNVRLVDSASRRSQGRRSSLDGRARYEFLVESACDDSVGN